MMSCALMVSPSVQMKTLAVSFTQGIGAAVHFPRLFAAMTKFIAVQVIPNVISKRKLVTGRQI